jgi:hypothetical protein
MKLAQCYKRDGCCCVINVFDRDNITTGTYQKDSITDEFYSPETNLYIMRRDSFWTIASKSTGGIVDKFYASKGNY